MEDATHKLEVQGSSNNKVLCSVPVKSLNTPTKWTVLFF